MLNYQRVWIICRFFYIEFDSLDQGCPTFEPLRVEHQPILGRPPDHPDPCQWEFQDPTGGAT